MSYLSPTHEQNGLRPGLRRITQRVTSQLSEIEIATKYSSVGRVSISSMNMTG